MEVGESVLDSINEELDWEDDDDDDIEMMEVEEGEFVDGYIAGEITDKIDKEEVKGISHSDNPQPPKNRSKRRKKKKKKKNKYKKFVPSSDGLDIDSFVVGVCKQLRERKSYLVYSAVGILGISALRDLVNEVDAVQSCGGQRTVLGDRYRTGGGVLWNILKARDPNAYKEIMKKGKEFEKQFRLASIQPHDASGQPRGASGANTNKPMTSTSNDLEIRTPPREQSAQPGTEEKRSSVHDRIRVPVTYDDLPEEEPVQGISSFL